MDLFILRTYRSGQLLRELYNRVASFCAAHNIRYILTFPNAKSAPINARFLKLKPVLWLPIRVGLSLQQAAASVVVHSGLLKSLGRNDAIELFASFTSAANQNGLHWDAKTLLQRLSDPTREYAVHTTAHVLLISSSRKTKSVGFTLLCGLLVGQAGNPSKCEIAHLVRAACRTWKTRAFVYVGVNSQLPKPPGTPLTTKLRRPILVQFRDLKSGDGNVRLDCLQLIDCDFA